MDDDVSMDDDSDWLSNGDERSDDDIPSEEEEEDGAYPARNRFGSNTDEDAEWEALLDAYRAELDSSRASSDDHDDGSGVDKVVLPPDGVVSARLRKHVFFPRAGEALTSAAVMVRIFRFFFPDELLELIARATMSKARELVVKDGSGTIRPLVESDSAALRASARPRSDALAAEPLTRAEVLVYLGIWVVMGEHPRAFTSDFWLRDPPGFRVALIADNMARDRFEAITAHLSFVEVDDARWPADKLRKFREINARVTANVRARRAVPAYIGVGKVRACYEELHAAAAKAESAQYAEFGFKRWFHLALGRALIETGMHAKDSEGRDRHAEDARGDWQAAGLRARAPRSSPPALIEQADGRAHARQPRKGGGARRTRPRV